MARSNLVPYAFVWEKDKTMDFSHTIAFHDINVSRFSQLNEYMNRNDYQRSKSSIDIGPNHSDSIFLNFYLLVQDSIAVLVSCKSDEDPIENEGTILNKKCLLVMESRVLTQSAQNPYAVFPSTSWMLKIQFYQDRSAGPGLRTIAILHCELSDEAS